MVKILGSGFIVTDLTQSAIHYLSLLFFNQTHT